ncbi:putative metal transport system ATP-binding protein CT_416 [Candidatus Magnetomoraceae bacterium gMMP-15]
MNFLPVKIKNLCFSFNGERILQDVNLTVYQDDFLAIIGPNGGGKTTLLKLMLGLFKPEQGLIRIFGKPPKKAYHFIGYVPQEININKKFPISVMDVVLMGRLNHGRRFNRYSAEDRKAALKSLELMEMSEYKDRPISDLSGGQQQRVFISRAMMAEPKLILLDEPTASVDSKGQTDLFELLKDLNKKAAIVVVSHDIGILSSHVKCIACVNRYLFYHSAAELTEEMLDAAYSCPIDIITHGVLPHRVLKEHVKS